MRDDVVAAAEAVLAAASELPAVGAGKEQVLVALRKYDAAETRLDDAMDAYMAAAAAKGKKR